MAIKNEDGVAAEAGRVGERGRLGHPAPGGQRLEVADGGALVPAPAGVRDELVDAERLQPLPLGGCGDEPEAVPLGRVRQVLDGHVAR